MQIANGREVPVNVCGSSTFGIYPKISLEKSYNFFITDDNWMVNYGGFKKVIEISPAGEGRGFFYSVRGGFLIAVVSNAVYRIDNSFTYNSIGTINSLSGDVYIDENLASQICIVDGQEAWIYNYSTTPPTFTLQTTLIDPISGLPFYPSYVAYHNTFFLFGSSTLSPNSSQWYAFVPSPTDPTMIVRNGSPFALQTKPDTALLVERLPGRGNNVLVLGSTVGEFWTQVGGLENYRRVQSMNIDSGIISVATLASNEEYVAWLSQNESNSPCIMMTDGQNATRISTDGIDHVLQQIQFPAQSTAFFFRQDGHLFYQLTFYNPADNLTLSYDFTTNKFFHISDQNLNYHPARHIAFFEGNKYFISLNDGGIYQQSTLLLTYDYDTLPNSVGFEIPRIRICKSIRLPNSDRFRCGQFTFWIEEGIVPTNSPTSGRVDLSVSKNGGQSFSNVVGRPLNPEGVYRNQIRWWRIGQANELIIQLRFWGFQRWCVSNGIAEIY